MITREQILEYEIRSSPLPSFTFGRFTDLASRYFAWKVKRKWRRYQQSLADAAELKQRLPGIF